VYPIVREMHSDTMRRVSTLRRRRGEEVKDGAFKKKIKKKIEKD
jgi:hypothetical protein